MPAIRHEQSVYLSRRLLALCADHDDLINETLWALTSRLRRCPSTFPASWFQHEPPKEEYERAYLHKLAMVILRRRIADLFRKRARFQLVFTVGEYPQDLADPNAPSLERRILLTKVLEIVRLVLDKVKAEDRELIAIICGDTGLRRPLDERERKRLERIRKKLRDEITRRLGSDVTDLLRNTP